MNKSMFNNDTQCQIGANAHPDFSAITEYRYGYHIVEKSSTEWKEYYEEQIRQKYSDVNDKHESIYLDESYIVTIPDHATVVIENSITYKSLTRYKTSHMILTPVQ